MEDNEKYMNVAIEEAKKGEYNTWTDPLVGCVIVKDGKILSTHQIRRALLPKQ